METPLSLQLQQAWLQTQMRKHDQTSFPNLPTPSSHGAPHSPSPDLFHDHLFESSEDSSRPPTNLQDSDVASSSSSWASAADSSWLSATSNTSLPLQTTDVLPQELSKPDEDSLTDPVLQYISDMLMDEDMEDRKCMMQECISYQALAKGFYEILGEENAGKAPCPVMQEAELASSDKYQWMDDLLNMEATQQEASAVAGGGGGVSTQNGSPPWSSDSSCGGGSALLSPQWAFESTDSSPELGDTSSNAPQQDPAFGNDDFPFTAASGPVEQWNGVSRAYGSFSSLNFASTDRQDNSFASGAFPQEASGLTEGLHDEHSDAQNNLFRRASSDRYEAGSGRRPSLQNESLDMGAGRGPSSENGRFKRASSEKFQDPSTLHRVLENQFGIKQSKSVQQPSVVKVSTRASAPAAWSVAGEDKLSFVLNENLNAERYAKIFHDDSVCSEDVLHKASSRAKEDDGTAKKRPGRPAATVDLRDLLLRCAQAVASDDFRKANEILQDIRQQASPYGDATQRLAHFFAEGLFARLSGTGARLYTAFTNNCPSAAKMLKAHHLFVEKSPSVKVSHYFANRAILKAAEGAPRLHIVDYGIWYGLQWPCLISALAERKGGPPFLHITGIDFPQPGYKAAERVEMTGRRLAEYAKTYGVPFEYHAVASKWENVQPSSLHLKEGEVLVVNSMHRLHHLLDETVTASNPRKTVLTKIRSLNPKIFVHGIKNATCNAPFFISRFREALFGFSSIFDMLDTTIPSDNQDRLMIEREVLGRDILNVVACEGPERVERPETYRQWQNRTQKAGFQQLPLDPTVVCKARAIVERSYHKDFGVEEDGRWMLLSWRGRIFNGLSVWQPSPADGN